MNNIIDIIDSFITPSFILTEAKGVTDDKYINNAKKALGDRLQSKLQSDDYLRNKADEIGFNVNFNPQEKYLEREKAFPNLQLSPEVNERTKKTIYILKQITNSTGGQNWNTLKNMVANNETFGMTYNEVLRMKDFVDGLNLRYLYDESAKIPDGDKFGINGDVEQLDLNNLTDKAIEKWREGSEERKWKYTNDEAFLEMKRNMLNKYLNSTYGVEAEIPNFSLGNKKVKDALMINFTSAFRCPAWNECLVRHACYARSGELQHNNAKLSNDKKHLMWESAHEDPQMMGLIENLLKAYVVDYNGLNKKITPLIRANKKNPEFSEFVSKVGARCNSEKLSMVKFSEMPQAVLDVVAQNTRVRDIRLNENGDFINQWLLDEFDRIAGEFKLIGVTSAAYSCRNLNFKGIKNIVVNASRIEMEGDCIVRYFYAIPEDMYNGFADTYKGTSISDEFNAIQRVPQPLYSIDENGNKILNGNYYYKCPCGRKDFKIKGRKDSSEEGINCYQCHLCYEAQSPEMAKKLAEHGGKLIVFVKAHGVSKNILGDEREAKVSSSVGVPFSYTPKPKEVKKTRTRKTKKGVNESFEGDSNILQSDEEAYQVIADNAIYSMYEHMNGIANNQNNMMQEQKNMFWAKFNKLNH